MRMVLDSLATPSLPMSSVKKTRSRTREPRAPRVTLARGRRRRPQGSEEFRFAQNDSLQIADGTPITITSARLSYGVRFGGSVVVAHGSGGACGSRIARPACRFVLI